MLTLNASMLVFGQANTVTTVSAANYRPIVAPDSIASAWGSGLAPNTIAANTTPATGQTITLPGTLGPVSLSVKDSGGGVVQPFLYMVSQGQINYVIPAASKLGKSALTVNSGTTAVTGTVLVSNVAPALFTADASGTGVPVGTVLRVTSAGVVTTDSLFQSGISTFLSKPINLNSSPSDKVYLILFGTGIRLHSLNPVQATIGGIRVPVLYAGAQSQYPGFDQINLGPLPQTLIGKGQADLILTVDGVPANTVRVALQ
ncbi:MAG: hypothetical protein ABI995_07540 [Acidobacteriota bacterium]